MFFFLVELVIQVIWLTNLETFELLFVFWIEACTPQHDTAPTKKIPMKVKSITMFCANNNLQNTQVIKIINKTKKSLSCGHWSNKLFAGNKNILLELVWKMFHVSVNIAKVSKTLVNTPFTPDTVHYFILLKYVAYVLQHGTTPKLKRGKNWRASELFLCLTGPIVC